MRSSVSQGALRARRRPLLAASAAALAAVIGVPSVARAASSPIKLRYRLRAGDQFDYLATFSGSLTVAAPGPAAVPPIHLAGRVRNVRTVLDALPDGRFTVADEIQGGEATATIKGVSKTSPIGAAPPQISTINALGRTTLSGGVKAQLAAVKSRFGFDPTEILSPLTMLQAFPEQAVGSGSRWQRTSGISIPPSLIAGSNFSLKIAIDSRLAKMKQVHGVSTAEIVSRVTVPVHIDLHQPGSALKVQGGVNGTVQTDFSVATGMAVESTGSMDGAILMHASGKSASANGPNEGRLAFNVTFTAQMVRAKRGIDSQSLAMLRETAGAPASQGAAFPSIPGLATGPASAPAAAPAMRTSGAAEAASPAASPPTAPAPEEPFVTLQVPTRRGIVQGEVTLQAVPSGELKEAGYVVFLVNGDHAYSTNSLPYRFDWDTAGLPAGVYTLELELYGANGELLYHSPARRVRVRGR